MPGALALLSVPSFLLVVYGDQGLHIILDGVVGPCQGTASLVDPSHVLYYLGKTLEVDVAVIGGHARVAFEGVLSQALGLQLGGLCLLLFWGSDFSFGLVGV